MSNYNQLIRRITQHPPLFSDASIRAGEAEMVRKMIGQALVTFFTWVKQ